MVGYRSTAKYAMLTIVSGYLRGTIMVMHAKRWMAATLERIYDLAKQATPRPQAAPTHKQIVDAAWGNVAAENPKVTIRDAQRAIKKA